MSHLQVIRARRRSLRTRYAQHRTKLFGGSTATSFKGITMLKHPNIKQIIVLVMGGTISLVFLLSLFYGPTGIIPFSLLMTALTVYLTLRETWILAAPVDNAVLIKPEAEAAMTKGLCPFCHTNPSSHQKLRVGYRKAKLTHFAYRVVWVEYAVSMNELTSQLPICDHCANTYSFLRYFKMFARFGLDRSYLVLRRKPGYFRGRTFPFEKGNLQRTQE
jgi:hypothetical protein